MHRGPLWPPQRGDAPGVTAAQRRRKTASIAPSARATAASPSGQSFLFQAERPRLRDERLADMSGSFSVIAGLDPTISPPVWSPNRPQDRRVEPGDDAPRKEVA